MNTSVPSHIQSGLLDVLLYLRDHLRQLYQEQFDHFILFGSYARGEATSDSDVDVLIVLDEPIDISKETERLSYFLSPLCLEHNLLISPLFMPKSRFESENSPLLRNIRSEGIAL